MSNIALISCSVTAGLLILIALLTPGWFGFDRKTADSDFSISMNMFYCRLCERSGANEVCVTLSVASAVSNGQFSMGEIDRYTELIIEAIFCLVCIVVGGICTVIFGASLTKRQDDMVGSAANFLGVTGLVSTIIGGVCGGILSFEFIIAHLRYDVSYVASELSSDGIEKYVPYSLIIMCIGLTVEFIAVTVHIVAQRNSYRAVGFNGIVLSPVVNAPSQVIVQHSTVSSTPYGRFA